MTVSIPSNGSSLFQQHIHLGIEHKVFIVIKIAMVDRFMIGGRGYIDKFFIIVYIASNCVGDNDFGNKVCKYVIIEQFSKIAQRTGNRCSQIIIFGAYIKNHKISSFFCLAKVYIWLQLYIQFSLYNQSQNQSSIKYLLAFEELISVMHSQQGEYDNSLR